MRKKGRTKLGYIHEGNYTRQSMEELLHSWTGRGTLGSNVGKLVVSAP